jgi:predicted acetyltransferase
MASRLERLSRAHAAALRAMAAEFHADGDPRFDDLLEDEAAFYARVDRFERGVDLPEDRVRMTWYLLFEADELLGAARLRHRLIPVLLRDGGHIGYEIRPSRRRRGCGQALLGLMLDEARAIGLDRVLLTTEATNTASTRLIEAAGGESDGLSVSPNTGETMRRFWIDL